MTTSVVSPVEHEVPQLGHNIKNDQGFKKKDDCAELIYNGSSSFAPEYKKPIKKRLYFRNKMERGSIQGCEDFFISRDEPCNSPDGGMVLAAALVEFMGVRVASLKNVRKCIRKYVRDKQLRSKKNRRIVECDETLQKLFKVKVYHSKKINEHIIPMLYSADQPEARGCEDLLLDFNKAQLAKRKEKASSNTKKRGRCVFRDSETDEANEHHALTSKC